VDSPRHHRALERPVTVGTFLTFVIFVSFLVP
jgi:hypothetical protein